MLNDRSTDPKCHPEDVYRWHHGELRTFRTSAATTLELQLMWCDHAVPAPDDIPPYVQISGDDASGSVVGLELRAGDLRGFAAQLVEIADGLEAGR